MKEKAALRFCKDIGMFSVDRSRKSCQFRTKFCEKACFNNKLYRVFGHGMRPKDIRNDAYWADLTGEKLHKTLSNKRHQTDRVRLMTRGEAIATHADLDKVIDIVKENPGRLVWVPTRAWRSPELRKRIEKELQTLENARVLASLDPSNTRKEADSLKNSGWSTMFFGDNETPIYPDESVKCPKTWDKTVSCPTCENGCFQRSQVHVWLKTH